MNKKHLLSLLTVLCLCAVPCLVSAAEEASSTSDEDPYAVSYEGISTGSVRSQSACHDPSILAAEGMYYIFGTHMSGAKSDNLFSRWRNIASGYSAGYSAKNPMYKGLLDSGSEALAYAGGPDSLIPTDDGGYHVWAPDVIYNKSTGKYMMYYCTSSTWNASNLCYGISDTPEGPYEWQGALIYSGFTEKNIDGTDVSDYVDRDEAITRYCTSGGAAYNYVSYPNALDPAVFYDRDDRLWMVYGSWSGGIFLLELSEDGTSVLHPEQDDTQAVDAYFGKRLLGGGHNSIEGPYILYDEDADEYYLFVSYGGLNRDGGYQIRVFRSKEVDGDYVDMNGNRPGIGTDHSRFGLKLSGNYMLPSLTTAYKATGHNSAFIDEDGKHYIVYHTRFDRGTEEFEDRIKQYFLNEEGWPCMLPYASQGETIEENGYDQEQLSGRYYMINQGTRINAKVSEPIMIELFPDGTITGADLSGTWSAVENSFYCHLTIDDQDYSGVFCRMQDEAGTSVMTFSAVGNNQSIWGVSYPENQE